MTAHSDQLAQQSLLGLTIGDQFGESFFIGEEAARAHIQSRKLPERAWRYTDDTAMAISIVRSMDRKGRIDPDSLAMSFASAYREDTVRGYGASTHQVLGNILAGVPWRFAASSLYNGTGSMGNGAAMRAAPIGAYHWDQPKRAAEEAETSAMVTHSHPEGIAGAIAVAVCASILTTMRMEKREIPAGDILRQVCAHTPMGATRQRIASACDMGSFEEAAQTLGNGRDCLSQDTVPYCLYCVAHSYQNYEEALWHTVSALGDRDTTCAIVGGIVVLYDDAIPAQWLQRAERINKGL